MADEFDPNTFDWGDPAPGVKLDDVGEDIEEIAIEAALRVHQDTFGWTYLKRSDVKETAGRLYRAKFFVPKEGREWLEEQYPAYTFVWDTALSHHDHPVSHITTELNEVGMVESLVREKKTWIDLFGNGNRDRKYKRKCYNMYSLKTPKDYIRYQKLGDYDVPYDLAKLCDPTSIYGKIDHVTCTHAAYYLSMDDIGRIVNTSKTRVLEALVHRHSDVHGFLNHKEQEYWVNEEGTVRQVNVRTGEKYSHPSLEALFHQGSARTARGGVAWTIKAAGGDSFIVKFVGCPNEICETFTPLRFLQPETRETVEYRGLTVKKFLHWTWMSASTVDGEVVIEDHDLFNKLRRYVAGKQRVPRLKTELMNHARRLCNKDDIISVHGGGASGIATASIHHYVEAAFYIDQRSELDMAVSLHKDNANITKALNAYYESGVTPKDFSTVTEAAVVTSRTFTAAAVRVINHLRECQDITVQEYVDANLPGADLRQLMIDYDPGDLIPAPWAGMGWI
jgi:hypothetical protein